MSIPDFTKLNEKELLQQVAATLWRLSNEMRENTSALIRAMNEVRDRLKKP